MSDIGINPFGGTAPASPANSGYSSTALQNLDKETFLKLLVAQMRYQNPMSPVDSNEFLAQAAQYASVEQLENMAQSQAEIRSMQMVSIATGLVGKEVTASDPLTGEPLTGNVEMVRFGVEPILVIDGVDVPMSSVRTVNRGTAPATASDSTPRPTPTESNLDPPPVASEQRAADTSATTATITPPNGSGPR